MWMRVLVVEDEQKLADVVKRGFEEDGYSVDTISDGLDALHVAETTPYDLIILDVMLPGIDGIEICRRLRQKNNNTSILMLTARDTVEDRVAGLDSGADDYLVKPFAFAELLARSRALLRRDSPSRNPQIQIGDLVLDTRTREVWRDKRRIELTTKEYAILEYLMRRPNAVITRTMLEEGVWDYEYDGISNVIDVYIRRLRKKIDDEEGTLIQTLRGSGYRLRVP
jgi:heavy metal response regulator